MEDGIDKPEEKATFTAPVVGWSRPTITQGRLCSRTLVYEKSCRTLFENDDKHCFICESAVCGPGPTFLVCQALLVFALSRHQLNELTDGIILSEECQNGFVRVREL